MSERRRIEAVYSAYERDGETQKWNEEQPGNAAILAERRRALEAITRRMGATERVLDIGCGRGAVLDSLQVGSSLRFGVDLLADRAADAARVTDVVAAVGDGTALPVADQSIDVAVAFTVFSSVLDDHVRRAIAAEITRVVRPGGSLLWYDLRRRNPSNDAVRPVTRNDLGQLFHGWNQDLRTITVLPPLARRLGPATRAAYPVLARLPLLRTHHIGLLTRLPAP